MKAPQAKRVACAKVLGERVSCEKRREHQNTSVFGGSRRGGEGNRSQITVTLKP